MFFMFFSIPKSMSFTTMGDRKGIRSVKTCATYPQGPFPEKVEDET